MSDFAQSNSDFASPPTPFSSSSTIYQGIASPVGIDARGCASSSGASSRMSINLKSSISTMVTKVKEGGAKIMNKINNTGKDDHDNSCEMSLNEIMDEIDEILVKVNSDQAYDADRLERLSELLEDNPEYQSQRIAEHQEWHSSVDKYLLECQRTMRSFIPLDIFSATEQHLIDNWGLPPQLAKRFIMKQSLWLIRMSVEEISSLHEVDLCNRYSCTTQRDSLDIVELAAIYCGLPENFQRDANGKKSVWKKQIENLLKELLTKKAEGELPSAKIRAVEYDEYRDEDRDSGFGEDAIYYSGPITDFASTRPYEVMSAPDIDIAPRRSFQDVCKQHSLFSKYRQSHSNGNS